MVDLEVTGAAITTQTLRCIVGCRMPLLRFLVIDNVQMNTANMDELAKGKWPQLQYLIIKLNPPRVAGGQTRIHGNWPALEHLSIRNCDWKDKVDHIVNFSLANWPRLEFLSLAWRCTGMAQANSQHGFPCLRSMIVADIDIEPDLWLPCLTELLLHNKQTLAYFMESAAMHAPLLQIEGQTY